MYVQSSSIEFIHSNFFAFRSQSTALYSLSQLLCREHDKKMLITRVWWYGQFAWYSTERPIVSIDAVSSNADENMFIVTQSVLDFRKAFLSRVQFNLSPTHTKYYWNFRIEHRVMSASIKEKYEKIFNSKFFVFEYSCSTLSHWINLCRFAEFSPRVCRWERNEEM